MRLMEGCEQFFTMGRDAKKAGHKKGELERLNEKICFAKKKLRKNISNNILKI